jgi:ABC-type transport system involved in cytochrome bd biosynthesis fused ATPase/permease subunit
MVMFVYVLKDLTRLHRDIDTLEFIYLVVTYVFHVEVVTYIKALRYLSQH